MQIYNFRKKSTDDANDLSFFTFGVEKFSLWNFGLSTLDLFNLSQKIGNGPQYEYRQREKTLWTNCEWANLLFVTATFELAFVNDFFPVGDVSGIF